MSTSDVLTAEPVGTDAAAPFAPSRSSVAKPKKSNGSPLARSMTTEAAIAALVSRSAAIIERNALIVMVSEEPEGPHQLRVGLRRLRSILKTARPPLARDALRPIESWARDLGRAASIWRDADVLVDAVAAPALAAGVGGRGAAALEKSLEAARASARVETRGALRDLGPAGFLDALGDLAERRAWRIDPVDRASTKAAKAQRRKLEQPARRQAERALDRSWRDAVRWGDRLDALTIDERHEMRKTLKTLRYVVDAYAPLYEQGGDAGAVGAFAKELRRLQNVFGYLNDVASAETLVKRAAPTTRPVAEKILAWHAERTDKAWSKAQRRWRALTETPRFW